MELLKITQCKTNLNFKPQSKAKNNLIATAYAGELLTGFAMPFATSPEPTVLNYQPTDIDFIELVQGLYPELSYLEILSLYSCLEKLPELSQVCEDFFMRFGFRMDANLELTNALVMQLPETFRQWCALKKWGPQDFAPLRACAKQIAELTPYLEKIAASPLSKSEGTQIFEILIELLLLATPLTTFLTTEVLNWLPALRKLRYPESSQIFKSKEAQLQKISWPLHSQAKWVRRGDRSGVELKLFFSHPQEFERSLLRLEQLKNHFSEDPEGQKLWTLDC